MGTFRKAGRDSSEYILTSLAQIAGVILFLMRYSDCIECWPRVRLWLATARNARESFFSCVIAYFSGLILPLVTRLLV